MIRRFQFGLSPANAGCLGAVYIGLVVFFGLALITGLCLDFQIDPLLPIAFLISVPSIPIALFYSIFGCGFWVITCMRIWQEGWNAKVDQSLARGWNFFVFTWYRFYNGSLKMHFINGGFLVLCSVGGLCYTVALMSSASDCARGHSCDAFVSFLRIGWALLPCLALTIVCVAYVGFELKVGELFPEGVAGYLRCVLYFIGVLGVAAGSACFGLAAISVCSLKVASLVMICSLSMFLAIPGSLPVICHYGFDEDIYARIVKFYSAFFLAFFVLLLAAELKPAALPWSVVFLPLTILGVVQLLYVHLGELPSDRSDTMDLDAIDVSHRDMWTRFGVNAEHKRALDDLFHDEQLQALLSKRTWLFSSARL